MLLYFIRHAQSANNALFLKTGARNGRTADPGLTELGHRQAQVLADYFASKRNEFSVDHIYTSLMQRAILTAMPTAAAFGLPLEGIVDLHETGGVYLDDEISGEPIGQPGSNRMELQSKFPSLVLPDNLDGNGWWNRPYEKQEDRPKRANRLVEWLLEKHPNPSDRVMLFSHFGFFNYFLWAVFGQVRPPNTEFYMMNTSITCFEFLPDEKAALYINRIDHLPAELVTI